MANRPASFEDWYVTSSYQDFVRREGAVLYVRNAGAQHEVPYVKVNGVWKVSVRDVLLVALKSRFGDDVHFHLLNTAKQEWMSFNRAVTDWERRRNFDQW